MKLYSKMLFIGLLISGLAGCATVGEPNLPDQQAAEAGRRSSVLVDAYTMDVGDVVQISVWNNAELSVTEPIRPDGKISLPLVGDVMAVGLEPEELASDIEQKLSNYVNNPNVTIILTSLAGHEFLSRIRVTGSVANDVSISYQQGMTVLDAVLEAGSLDVYADGNRTRLFRRTADSREAYDIRLNDIMKKGDMTTNVYLKPGDIVSVPERRF